MTRQGQSYLNIAPTAGELAALRQQQAELTRQVEGRQAKLDRAFAEFHAIPVRAEAVKNRLEQIANFRKELNPNALKSEYKSAFRLWIDSATPNAGARMQRAVQLSIESAWRLEAFAEWESEARAELAELTSRDKALSKQLNIKRNLK